MMLVYSFDARRHSDGRGEPAARVIDWVVPSDQDLTASPQERRRAAVLAARKLGLFAAPRNAFRFEESSRGVGWYTCPWTSNLQDKARQAEGGVQLVRLSFPPEIDVDAVCRAVADAVAVVYTQK